MADDWDVSDIAFDIRADHYGGAWPMRGVFRLRSFHSILGFLGKSIGTEADYYVEKDARTPPILNDENPDLTMELVVSSLPAASFNERLIIDKTTRQIQHQHENMLHY